MINLIQLFSNKNADLYILIFALVMLVFTLINLLYLLIVEKKTIYINISKKKQLFNIIFKKIFPIAFALFFFLWTIIFLFPEVTNAVLVPDNSQKITLKNTSKETETYLLLGRLTYHDIWIPIIPTPNNFNITPTVKVTPNTEKNIMVRAGLDDIRYLAIYKSYNSMKYSELASGLTLELPQNDIVLYSNSFKKNISNKPTVTHSFYYISTAIYFTALLNCLWIFLKISYSSNIKIILYVLLLSSISILSAYLLYLSITSLLIFI